MEELHTQKKEEQRLQLVTEEEKRWLAELAATKTVGMDGGGELKERQKPERRGQRLLGVSCVRGSVYMAWVSFVFLMSKFVGIDQDVI